MGSITSNLWMWIGGLTAAIFSIVGAYFALPVIVKFVKRLGWWLVGLLTIAVVVAFLFVIPRRFPAQTLPDSALPAFLHDGYWGWMLLFLLATLGSTVPLVRAARARKRSALVSTAGPTWDDLDRAWDEILVRLSQAKIDPSKQKVFLLLAPSEEDAASVVNSAGLQVFVEAPAGQAPVHAYATSDGLFLSVSGACGFGAGAGGAARLESLANRLLSLQPDCPVVRGVVVVFPMEWASRPESVNQAAAVREDLRALRRTLHVGCPVFGLFSGMENVPGATEFAARLASQVHARMLEQRVGFAVPTGEPFTGDLVQRGLIWMSGWFHSWILNLLAGDPLNDAGNSQLVTLDHDFRRYRKRLRAILESAFSTHRETEPVPFRGCYFVATGDERLARAFSAGLLRGHSARVIAEHVESVWDDQAVNDDRRYRNYAILVGVIGFALAAAAWLSIATRTPFGYVGLILMIVGWVAGIAWMLKRR